MSTIIQPVALITTSTGDTGTGFLVDETKLFTTALLFPDEHTACGATVKFKTNDENQLGYTHTWKVRSGSYQYDIERDLASVELEPDECGRRAGNLWGYYQQAPEDCLVEAFDELTYVHYGEEGDVESDQVLVVQTDEMGAMYYYGCWLFDRSAGAPLLNDKMQVVGVHSRKFGPATECKHIGARIPQTQQVLQLST